MKRLVVLLIFASAALCMPLIIKTLSGGFKPSKVRGHLPESPAWEVGFDPALLELFKQPYTYIGKGSQCYVFESKDREWAIKFFRSDHFDSKHEVFPLFDAVSMAYQHLKEETGLIYIHLNQTQLNLPVLVCKDAIGRSYRLPLDELRFAVQKKAKPFQAVLKEALSDPDQMRKRLDQFIDLLLQRTAKGIFNADPSLSRNFGFLEQRAIEIDVGNFTTKAPHSREDEIERYMSRLRSFLKKVAPEWIDYANQKTRASLDRESPS